MCQGKTFKNSIGKRGLTVFSAFSSSGPESHRCLFGKRKIWKQNFGKLFFEVFQINLHVQPQRIFRLLLPKDGRKFEKYDFQIFFFWRNVKMYQPVYTFLFLVALLLSQNHRPFISIWHPVVSSLLTSRFRFLLTQMISKIKLTLWSSLVRL